MLVAGRENFAAPAPVLFACFTNPEALRRCTPGCETLEPDGPNQYRLRVCVGVASIKGSYTGHMHLEELSPPHSFRLRMDAAGSTGFVRGTGEFRFLPEGDSTIAEYAWDVAVGGLIAGVGQRVLSGVSKLLIGQFFKGMRAEVARGGITT